MGESSRHEQELPADAPVVRLRTIGLLTWAATKPKFLYEMPDRPLSGPASGGAPA
jgi:hypothetical protein